MDSPVPAYVINLDRVPARWDFVRDQFAGAGIGDIQRFAAVDAKAPGFEAPGYAPHTWRDRWELSRSAQAVFESHRALWHRVRNDHPDGAVICEDDILISGRFGAALGALDLHAHGVIKLDGFNAVRRYGPGLDIGGWTVRPILTAAPSAACYALSARAADLLIQASQRYCATLDDFLLTPRPGLTPMQLFPAVAVQGMCCAPDALPGDIAQSERAPQGQSPKVNKGPARYRLAKESRRLRNRVAIALGANRRLIAAGGVVAMPDLADDLPGYRS